MTARVDCDRFESAADKYLAYLQAPEGRLRLDLALSNLEEFLPTHLPNHSLHALDLGCGTGALAARLARLGISVTLVDSSRAMLDIAERTAFEAQVIKQIVLIHGNATEVAKLTRAQSFDVVLCHNLLEYVDDPSAVLRGAARALRDSSAILSVLVRNQAGEVLKAAIQGGDLAAAETAMSAEWGQESLYGGPVRLFTYNSLQALLEAASLALAAERGVRIIADYLPPGVSRTKDYERILKLERQLGRHAEFAAVARYRQWIARRAQLTEQGA